MQVKLDADMKEVLETVSAIGKRHISSLGSNWCVEEKEVGGKRSLGCIV